MSQIETYDPSNIDSIQAFADKLTNYDDRNCNEEFLMLNINKTINELEKVQEKDYETQRNYQLIRVLSNILFFVNSEKLIDEIVKTSIYSIYANMIDFELNKKEKIEFEFAARIVNGLISLTYGSLSAAVENIKYDFHRKTLDLLQHIDLVQSIESKNDELLGTFLTLVNFIEKNSTYVEVKEALVGINIVKYLLEQSRKLDIYIKQRNELKYIKSILIGTVANLLTDQELDTLPVTDEFVLILIDIFNEIVTSSSTNRKILENTKYYTSYTINKTTRYLNATRHLSKIKLVAVNDSIKAKLYEAGIIPMIKVILQNGNENELEKCTDLLCSLCFNENVAKHLRENGYNQLINDVQGKATKSTTKSSCQQILQMMNNVLQKRAASAKQGKTGGHIMISYNHKYKDVCTAINDELKKRGFNTWMDSKSVFTDLHDAIAEAIEKASIVLICYSHEYKISNNCRLEAQYAFKLNKNLIPIKLQSKYDPDGWLGMILATKLYIDFTKDLDSAYNSLCNQIDVFIHKKDYDVVQRPQSSKATAVNVQQVQTHERPPSRNIASASRKTGNKPKDMTNEEVQSWLKNNNMGTLVNVFKTCSGTTLKALHEMKQKDYTQFCNTIEKEIEKSKADVDTFEKLNFYENLERLFQQ